VRRVVDDGHSAYDVAREVGVGVGSLFFWVRRYRQFAQASRLSGQAFRPKRTTQIEPNEAGTLVAYLRRGRGGSTGVD
jgi:transposase-like protein